MDRKKLEKAIAKKLTEIWKLYHEVYPEGKYLSMFFEDGFMNFDNAWFDEDKFYKISHFEKLEDTEDDL